MRITSLKLANVRAIKAAEFRFQPGFNLVVGVNGVGKSTVLDALRICISRILPAMTESRAKAQSFTVRDIRSGYPFLDAELLLSIDDDEFRFTRCQWRDTFAADDVENIEKLRREILDSERLRDRRRRLLRELEESHAVSHTDAFTPSKADLKSAAHTATVAPNCIFFSTNRSVASYASTAKSRAAGGKSAAYAEALIPRPMYLAQFADWMRVQEALGKEQGAAKRHLQVLRSAVDRFLPAYEDLRPADKESSRLLINQGGIALEVGQLSDGERGVLALVIDLARRLSQANPSLDDPLSEGHAVVLIDEIDLHLHPKWQRDIVHKLRAIFPQCQFIATTHSPQIIGEVEHDRIQIIANGEVYSPTHSFGVDSSRLLEEIMEAPSRDPEVSQLHSEVNQAIGENDVGRAREVLTKLTERLELGENDPDVTRLRTLIDFVEGND